MPSKAQGTLSQQLAGMQEVHNHVMGSNRARSDRALNLGTSISTYRTRLTNNLWCRRLLQLPPGGGGEGLLTGEGEGEGEGEPAMGL